MRTSIVVMMIVASSLVASCGKKQVESQIDTSIEEIEVPTEMNEEEVLSETEDSVEVLEEVAIPEQ
ncbi:hypothetical protein [Cyclobacterium amurskyense]|jgi:major membrane immunogen (membrane-anchored lipoprotein)|uniref:Uncharacterized protein n=1 Tax=Cyclobacterium amurskyense TaxID=320787 RepID=A0A0H4PIB1_9BACT|nr:hypothetical protein [Cyclobacterium amurskyense]AKP52785.1 hypothetical protein CA2015_3396 [Cyclobacterium amurskyense]|tara:strand:- start:553 stop:750 length:198 start_codon:yes stop_codon:yes gene_type:complete